VQGSPADNIFRRSWTVLTANPILFALAVIIGIIALIVPRVYSPFVGMLGIIYTIGIGAAAWEGKSVTFADGGQALSKNGGAALIWTFASFIVYAVPIGFLMRFLPSFNNVWTSIAAAVFFISGVFYICFYTYGMSAIIVHKRTIFGAFRESVKILSRSIRTTSVVAAGYLVVTGVYVVLSMLPFIGTPLASLLLQIGNVYLTLVLVGEFITKADGQSKAADQPAEPS